MRNIFLCIYCDEDTVTVHSARLCKNYKNHNHDNGEATMICQSSVLHHNRNTYAVEHCSTLQCQADNNIQHGHTQSDPKLVGDLN